MDKDSNNLYEKLTARVAALRTGKWTLVPVARKGGKLEVAKKFVRVLDKSGHPKAAPDDRKVREAGEKIVYEITVTNAGDLTLRDIDVTDANAAITSGSPIAVLAPGATAVVTTEHEVEQADVDAGKVDNVAVAKGKDPQDKVVSEGSMDPDHPGAPATTVEIDRTPAMKVKKSFEDYEDKNGTAFTHADSVVVGESKVVYEIKVENTGNTTLTGIELTDAYADATPAGSWKQVIFKLEPGKDTTITDIKRTVTQDDMDKGKAENVAFATAKSPAGDGSTTETVYESSKDPGTGQ